MSSKPASDIPAAPTPNTGQRTGWSLAARLTAWYALSSFALLCIASAILYWALSTYLNSEDDEFLETKIRVVEKLLQRHGEESRQLRSEVAVTWAAHEYHRVYARLLDEHGNVLMSSQNMAERVPLDIFPAPGTEHSPIGKGKYIRPAGGQEVYRAMSARIREAPDKPLRILQIAVNETSEFRLLGRYRNQLWLVLTLAFIACALIGYEIARRGLRPVRDIALAAGRIRSTTLHERIRQSGQPRELAALAVTFNEMLDRLEEAFARLSAFSGNIAHELRTPVNTLRGELEVALSRTRSPADYMQVLTSSLEECTRISWLIDSLMFLARAESPQAMVTRKPLDVSAELTNLREFYDAAAADAGLTLQLKADGSNGGLRASLDRALFQRAVGNVVENALAHTPSGGTVTISAIADNGLLRVRVRDTGPGIPPEHLPYIFERFHRVDAARSRNTGGMGLGLAIARSITVLHGGSADAASSPGDGTQVTLTFPRDEATGAPRGK